MQAKIKFASIVLTKSQLERSWWQNAVFGAVTSPKILKLCVHVSVSLSVSHQVTVTVTGRRSRTILGRVNHAGGMGVAIMGAHAVVWPRRSI